MGENDVSCLWCNKRKPTQNVELNIDGWGWTWEKFCANDFELLREQMPGNYTELDGKLVARIDDEEGFIYVGSSNPIPRW